MMVPVAVKFTEASTIRAKPKSVNRQLPPSSIRTLLGLTSRWTEAAAMSIVECIADLRNDLTDAGKRERLTLH